MIRAVALAAALLACGVHAAAQVAGDRAAGERAAGDRAAGDRAAVAEAHADAAEVTFFLRNNKGWFRTVSFVTYAPRAARGEVETRVLFPFQRTRFRLPSGAKLFIATEEEVQAVLAGGDLRRRAADLTVRPDDEGEVYAIHD